MKANYSQAKVYKICNSENDKIYVGSTIYEIQHRFNNHQYRFKKWKENNQQGYCSSYEILKYNDPKIEVIEYYPCSDRAALTIRELYHIAQNDARCVNIVRGHTCPEQLHEMEMKKARLVREKRALKKKQAETQRWLDLKAKHPNLSIFQSGKFPNV